MAARFFLHAVPRQVDSTRTQSDQSLLCPADDADVNLHAICAEGDGRWQTAFLPVFRISKRLAQAVLDGLKKKKKTGSNSLNFLISFVWSHRDYDLTFGCDPNRSSRGFHPYGMRANTRMQVRERRFRTNF
jgi:hypothetical protein